MKQGLAFRVLAILLALPVASCSAKISTEAEPKISTDAGPNVGTIAVGNGVPVAVFKEGTHTQVSTSTLLELEAGTTSCKVQQLTINDEVVIDAIQVSAGTITITGGQAPVVLSPTEVSPPDGGLLQSYYGAGVSQFATAIAPGDSLTVTATGATVPAFSVDIVVPQPITLTSPDPMSAMSASGWTISRSTDFPFVWTGGSTGNVSFSVGQWVGSTYTVIECEAPASAGSGVIPATALGYLTPAPAAYNGPTANVGVYSKQAPTVDGWDINVTAVPGYPIQSAVTIE